MQKWEYKYLFINFEDRKYSIHSKDKTIIGNEIIVYINELGDDGWELINVVQRIGNEAPLKSVGQAAGAVAVGLFAGPQVTPQTQYKTATLGYALWFKRPREVENEKNCKSCGATLHKDDSHCHNCGALQ